MNDFAITLKRPFSRASIELTPFYLGVAYAFLLAAIFPEVWQGLEGEFCRIMRVYINTNNSNTLPLQPMHSTEHRSG
jgi:hypothetical protein